jgi:hypothetical protein
VRSNPAMPMHPAYSEFLRPGSSQGARRARSDLGEGDRPLRRRSRLTGAIGRSPKEASRIGGTARCGRKQERVRREADA